MTYTWVPSVCPRTSLSLEKEGIYTLFLSLCVTKPREMMVTTEPFLLPVTRVGFFTANLAAGAALSMASRAPDPLRGNSSLDA